ncbi:MAG: YdcF family protein [Nitrospiraceae bacterium]|nr:YdcF family protein [Nitrospiraceae bacterium]
MLARGLEKDYSIPKNPKADVIILLGGGVMEDVPDITGTGTPATEMYARLVAAVRLHRMIGAPIIISGGRVFNNDPEAVVIKRFLVDLGVPSSKIYTEEESNDTLENALNTKIIMMKHGFKKPLILTTAIHMRRAELSFKKAGVSAQPYPIGFTTMPQRQYSWYHFLPQAHNMHNIAMAMHEYIGCWFYKIVY